MHNALSTPAPMDSSDERPGIEAEAAIPAQENHAVSENGSTHKEDEQTFKEQEPSKKLDVSLPDTTPQPEEPRKKLDVALQDPILVYPSTATPNQRLYLSPLDRLAPLFIYSLYFYKKVDSKRTGNVFNVLKSALEKNLVAYYPAAGRVIYNSKSGEPELHCYEQGVMLVEASTDARIEDFGDMRDANQDFEKFISKVAPGPDTPLLVSQVTRCGCGGFVLGFGSRHELFDGLSALQFLSDWASRARGESETEMVTPCHERELLKPKPVSSSSTVALESLYLKRFQGIPLLGIKELARLHSSPKKHVMKAFSISDEMITSLKEKALEGGELSTCTTFDVVTAHAWLARIKALQLEPPERVLLEFTVNTRPKIVPPLPPKFIGNAFIIAHCNRGVDELLTAPFHSVVKAVQEAKAAVTDTFVWTFIEAKNSTKLAGLPSFRETTIVSDWTKFSFHQLDFGWGAAAFATPVAMVLPDILFLLRDGQDKGGICLKLGLLPEVKDAFERHFYHV